MQATSKKLSVEKIKTDRKISEELSESEVNKLIAEKESTTNYLIYMENLSIFKFKYDV